MITLPKSLDNCLLRAFTADDAEALAALEYDPDVKRYVGAGIPKPTREEFLANFSEKLDMLPCAIQAPDGRLAGRASLDRSGVLREPTITIVLGKDFQGVGLGHAIARCLIDDWFSDARSVAVRAEVHQDNAQSLALLRRLGFTDTGERNHLGHCIFRVDRAAWQGE